MSMTCQLFQHSLNLFSDCGAYGDCMANKEFSTTVAGPLCVLSHAILVLVMSDQSKQNQSLYLILYNLEELLRLSWKILWHRAG